MKYKTRTIEIMILPEGEPTFSEAATTIKIEDEAGGEFLIVSQCDDSEKGEIRLDSDEWLEVRAGIDLMFAEIEANKAKP